MFRELQKRLKEVIEVLEEGGWIDVSKIENQYGELIPEISIKYDPETGKIIEDVINCYSSADLGLGTCLCNSHPSRFLFNMGG